jgi:hypothetical protein
MRDASPELLGWVLSDLSLPTLEFSDLYRNDYETLVRLAEKLLPYAKSLPTLHKLALYGASRDQNCDLRLLQMLKHLFPKDITPNQLQSHVSNSLDNIEFAFAYAALYPDLAPDFWIAVLNRKRQLPFETNLRIFNHLRQQDEAVLDRMADTLSPTQALIALLCQNRLVSRLQKHGMNFHEIVNASQN